MTGFTEDILVQQTTVENLEQQLDLESVFSSHHAPALSCLTDGEMTL